MAFSVLTAAQGARLRNRIGDTDTASPYLSDSVLDSIYSDNGLDLDKSTVAALQEMVGIFAMHVDIGGATEINEQRRQRFEHLQTLLKYWEAQTGLGGYKIQVGTLDLGLDRESDDTEYLDA